MTVVYSFVAVLLFLEENRRGGGLLGLKLDFLDLCL